MKSSEIQNCEKCHAQISTEAELFIILTVSRNPQKAAGKPIFYDGVMCSFDCLETWARGEGRK